MMFENPLKCWKFIPVDKQNSETEVLKVYALYKQNSETDLLLCEAIRVDASAIIQSIYHIPYHCESFLFIFLLYIALL